MVGNAMVMIGCWRIWIKKRLEQKNNGISRPLNVSRALLLAYFLRPIMAFSCQQQATLTLVFENIPTLAGFQLGQCTRDRYQLGSLLLISGIQQPISLLP